MKQLAQYQDGRLELQEVPIPMPPPGGILVRTTCSVISPGTERIKVEQARMSLLQKAKARPDQVVKVVDTARTLGWKSALQKVRNRLESPYPLGYSAAGIVIAVDPLNTRFQVGDRVACGGAECAFHAEMIAVPDLLASRIPDGVENWQAAYTTLASISMEAVRQSNSRLGERVLVIGQGLVGLLTTSLLEASGARVMATDFLQPRLDAALAMGAERVIQSNQSNIAEAVLEWTEGHGVDAVLLCIGGKGKNASDLAISCLRDRGVMVIVGMHDAELTWKSAYIKDIQVRYSRSYGPGRYDPNYEWGSHDYPIGHVRWTENRNFEACLQLMKSGQLDLAPITTRSIEFENVIGVYDHLDSELGVLITYPNGASVPQSSFQAQKLFSAPNVALQTLNHACNTLDVIGAGNFARTMLLPHLKGELTFGTIVNRTGLSANHVKQKFDFNRASTDASDVFSGSAGSVVIATCHHLHAPLTLLGLAADKHLFVEKPMCLSRDELTQIDQAVLRTKGSLMIGFNRRFAPATQELKILLESISGPKSLAFHIFAGPLSPDHWYAQLEQSGGRIIGEACHFFDYACHLLGTPIQVTAQEVGRHAFPDSMTAQIEFSDGSSAQIIYSAQGDAAFPKESFRLFGSGFVAECENFQRLTIYRNRKQRVFKFSSKGHAEEMNAWLKFLKGKSIHPLAYPEAQQSMRLTFAAMDSIRESRTIAI